MPMPVPGDSRETATVELVEAAAIEATYPVAAELRPHLTEADYVAAVSRMMADGFRLAAVRSEGRVMALAGYHVRESLSWGRHLYVADLVTTADARSRGWGKILLDWLKAEARREGCAELHLDSGVQRHGAHRFYLRERMEIVAYHFKASIG